MNNLKKKLWNGKMLLFLMTMALFAPWTANAQNRSTLTFDFEDQVIPSNWANTTAYPWSVTNAQNHTNGGSYCIKSYSGAHGQTSSISIEVECVNTGSISFCYRISSESSYDEGYFKIDGTTYIGPISGNDASWSSYSHDVAAGTHTFSWEYTKDGTGNNYEDSFYVDDIVIDLGDPLATLPKPTGLTCTLTEGDATTATLDWTENGSATLWQVCLNNDEANLITANSHPYLLTGLTPETAYFAKVRAYNGTNFSRWSNTVSFTPTNAISLTVYAGTATNRFIPMYGYYFDNCTKSECIIPATQLAEMSGGTITAITFYAYSVGSNSPTWTNTNQKVFLKEVGSTTLGGSYSGMEDATVVFDGLLPMPTTSTDGYTILFSEGYDYNGGNLLIGVYNDAAGTYNDVYWYGTDGLESGVSAYGYNSSLSSVGYNPLTFLPKTTFSYLTTSTPKPKSLTASNVTSHGAILSWTAPNENVTSYEYQYKAGGGGWTILTSTNNTSVTLTGLDSDTEYTFQVKAMYADGESDFASTTFHTLVSCPTPTGLQAALTGGNGTIATLSWTEVGEATNWVLEYGPAADFTGATSMNVSGTASQNLTGLEPETKYYARVKADCGGGDQSQWSDVLEFTPTNDYFFTVCDGTTTNSYVPIYVGGSWDGYFHSQFIIPASSLSGMSFSEITKMTFYATQMTNWGNASFKVYLAETNATTLSSFQSWNGLTQVYEGSLSIVDNKMVVELATPFSYTNGNLLVGFYQTGYGNDYHPSWYGVTATGASLSGTTGYPYQRNFLPKTTFAYQVISCPKPTGLQAALTEGNGSIATLSWTENGEATNWVLQIATNNTFTQGVQAFNVSNMPTKDLTGLTPETQYYARVKADCGDNDQSLWSNVIDFTPTNAVLLTVNDASNTNEFIPIYGYYIDYKLTSSQFIIPASILGDMINGQINKLTFYTSMTSANWDNATFKVYLTETAETTLSDLQSWESMTEVYEGSISIANKKMTIELDTPFPYMGGNLLVGFNQTLVGGTEQGHTYWYGITATGASLGGYNDGGISQQNFLPKTTFSYIPSAYPRVHPVISIITAHTVDFAWTAPNNNVTGYSYQYKTSTGEWPTEWTGLSVATTTLTLEGLTASTDYEFRIKALYGGHESEPTVLNFTMACDYAELPISEDFESYTGTNSGATNNLPDCWNYLNTCSNTNYQGYPVICSNSSNAHSGSNYLAFYSYSWAAPRDQYAILPLMENVSELRMEFYARLRILSSNDGGTIVVGVMTNPADANTFTAMETITPTSTTYEKYEVSFSDYSGNGNYIAIKMLAAYTTNNYNSSGVFIDDILVEEIPHCATPSSLAVVENSITTTSVGLSWTFSGEETAWRLQYKQETETEWTTLSSPVTTNPYTLTGLDHTTTYQVRLATHCDPDNLDDISPYCDPISFTTQCGAITTFPWTENFDEFSSNAYFTHENLPQCWNHINNTSYASFANYPLVYDDAIGYGYGCLFFNCTPYHDPQDQYAILPPMDNLDELRIKFYAKLRNNSFPASIIVGVMSDPADESTFIPLSTTGSLTMTNKKFKVSFEDVADNYHYIAFKMEAATTEQKQAVIDNIVVEPIPNCEEPEDLTVEAVTGHMVTISWTDVDNNPTEWQVYLSTDNVMPVELVATDLYEMTSNPATITGLDPETDYYVWVRANCGAPDVYSAWSDPISFTTDIACQKPNSLHLYEVVGFRANVSWEAGGDESSWKLRIASYDAITNAWNNYVELTPTNETTYTLTGLTPQTTYRVQVKALCGGSDGESEWTNYVQFTTPEACPKPGNITFSSIGHYDATVNWNGISDSYTVSYRTAPTMGAPIFSEDFSNGLNGWTMVNCADGSGVNNGMFCFSYPEEDPGQYLISPMISGITAEAMLEFTCTAYWDGSFMVGYSTTNNDIASFTYGNGVYFEFDEEWGEYSYSGIIPAGTKYIAIISTSYDDLYIDDVVIGVSAVGEWQAVTALSNTVNLNNLTMNTEYQLKVQGHCEGDLVSNESDMVTFTTRSENYKIFKGTVNQNWHEANNWEPTGIPTPVQDVELRADANILSGAIAQVKRINSDNYTLTVKDGGQLVADYGRVTVEKHIDGFGTNNSSSGWYFIALPVGTWGVFNPLDINGMIDTDHPTYYDLYQFNQCPVLIDGVGKSWENYKNLMDHFPLYLYQGYLYANKNDVDLAFTGYIIPEYSEEFYENFGVICLEYADEQESYDMIFRDWNLIGNPFTFNAYIDRSYYRINASGTDIEAVLDYMDSDNRVAPCTGIMVKADYEGDCVTFSKEPQRSRSKGSLNITLSQSPISSEASSLDKAIISFNEGSQLRKLVLNQNNAKLYIPQNGKDYAIVVAQTQDEIPVNFKAAQDGNYTLSINPKNIEMSYMHLIDNLTGADIDLKETSSYTFSAKLTDSESRFRLVFGTAY